jgi:hypothetical protein
MSKYISKESWERFGFTDATPNVIQAGILLKNTDEKQM